MSRRRQAIKRTILPDTMYNSILIGKMIHIVMERGKKTVAESAVYNALKILSERSKMEPMEAFEKSMANVRPLLEVKSRRVGGATYQVPIEVTKDRGDALALRWIITYSRKKKGIPFEKRLAGELTDAFNNTGTSVKKREDTHRMAEANRAFAHYRW